MSMQKNSQSVVIANKVTDGGTICESSRPPLAPTANVAKPIQTDGVQDKSSKPPLAPTTPPPQQTGQKQSSGEPTPKQ